MSHSDDGPTDDPTDVSSDVPSDVDSDDSSDDPTAVATDGTSDAFGAIDPDEVGTSRHRRWLIPVTGLIVAVAGAAALLLAAPWDDGAPPPSAIILAPAPSETVAEPTLDRRQILDAAPAGYEPAWLFDNLEDQGAPGQSPDVTFALFAAEGTEISSGAWVSFEIMSLTSAEASTFSAGRFLRDRGNPQDKSETVDVNGIDGAIGNDWDGTDMLVFGPLDGRSVTIRSNEMATESVLEYARSLKVVDGVAGLASNDVTTALPLLTGSRNTSGSYGLFAGGAGGASVSYSDDGNIDVISIGTSRPVEADPFPVLDFLITNAHDTTVHGERAIIGELDQTFDGNGISVVSWIEGGLQITVAGAADTDDLLVIAESVRTADGDEWDNLQDEAAERQQEQDNSDPFLLGTFLVDAGNTSSGSRWRIEASFDDGQLSLCYEGTINSGSGCPGVGSQEFPILQRVGDFSVGFSGVAAFIDTDAETGADGAVLEIEIVGESTLRIPLHDIDESFPGPGAAYAASVEQDYTATLVDGDGAVLDSIEITGRGD